VTGATASATEAQHRAIPLAKTLNIQVGANQSAQAPSGSGWTFTPDTVLPLVAIERSRHGRGSLRCQWLLTMRALACDDEAASRTLSERLLGRQVEV
jgi:hypothetical protein